MTPPPSSPRMPVEVENPFDRIEEEGMYEDWFAGYTDAEFAEDMAVAFGDFDLPEQNERAREIVRKMETGECG